MGERCAAPPAPVNLLPRPATSSRSAGPAALCRVNRRHRGPTVRPAPRIRMYGCVARARQAINVSWLPAGSLLRPGSPAGMQANRCQLTVAFGRGAGPKRQPAARRRHRPRTARLTPMVAWTGWSRRRRVIGTRRPCGCDTMGRGRDDATSRSFAQSQRFDFSAAYGFGGCYASWPSYVDETDENARDGRGKSTYVYVTGPGNSNTHRYASAELQRAAKECMHAMRCPISPKNDSACDVLDSLRGVQACSR